MDLFLWCLAPTHPPLSVHLWARSSAKFLAVSHTGRHPKNWLSGIPSVQSAVQVAETSKVVASLADAYTPVSVLAKPALPGAAVFSCVSSTPSMAAHFVRVL